MLERETKECRVRTEEWYVFFQHFHAVWKKEVVVQCMFCLENIDKLEFVLTWHFLFFSLMIQWLRFLQF